MFWLCSLNMKIISPSVMSRPMRTNKEQNAVRSKLYFVAGRINRGVIGPDRSCAKRLNDAFSGGDDIGVTRDAGIPMFVLRS
jgi:hypothetical protein